MNRTIATKMIVMSIEFRTLGSMPGATRSEIINCSFSRAAMHHLQSSTGGVPLPAMHVGFWPAITRRQGPPSPLPRLAALAADEWGPWLGAHDPEARQHHWKGHDEILALQAGVTQQAREQLRPDGDGWQEHVLVRGVRACTFRAET